MAKKHEEYYFESFCTLMDFAGRASSFLLETINNFNVDTLEARMNGLHEIEHAADLAKHEVMEKLAREFITPIEREDIMDISQRIDDVTDTIEDVIRLMYMYDVRVLRPETTEFCALIHKCCVMTCSVLNEFSNFRKSKHIHGFIVDVNALEEDGDRLHNASIRKLCTESKDAVEILKWTKLFDCLEDCCDACEDVCDVVELVIMKNS